ncbi:MAG: hypothetical protein JRJ87_25945 [Deltaproteobacteria bacterium]|nr:hypothetical protein [Deltaproteobacteria bacterium]
MPLLPTKATVDKPTMERLLKQRQKQIECEREALDILADGKVDRADRVAIEKYKAAFPEMVALQSQVFQALTGQFEVSSNDNNR